MIQAVTQPEPFAAGSLHRDLMGSDYTLWSETGETWAFSRTFGTSADHRLLLSNSFASSVAELVRQVSTMGQPQLKRISVEHFAWAIPFENANCLSVAVRFVGNDPDVLAELINQASLGAWTREMSLQHAHRELRQHDERMMESSDSRASDLLELQWLRNLATNLELSESDNSIEQIAETVLPSLCGLLNASTLIFVRDVAVTGMDNELPVIWQTGAYRMARQRTLGIIAALTGNEADRIVVFNNDALQEQSGVFRGIQSCALVPVATQSSRQGWLLAVNRNASKTSGGSEQADSYPQVSTSGERHFSSIETSLMQATAVVLAAHSRNCGLFQEKELLLRGVIRSMVNAIDAKDSYTCGHSDRVAVFAKQIARELKLELKHCEQIYMTGLLHDVGKIGVPDHVLKKPGQLTEAEFELIKQHPVVGYEILKHLENLDYVLPGVLHHHEAVDGSGYPHGLTGENIPLEARILAVADAYDAMTSNRPYRRGMPTEKAEQIIRDGAGRQWDAGCVDAFFQTIESIRLVASQKSVLFQASTPSVALIARNANSETVAVG